MIVTRYLIRHRLGEGAVLWLNTLTNAIDIADDRMNALLDRCRTGDLTAEDEQDVEVLRERGYLLASEAEEQALFERLGHMSANLKKKAASFIICPTLSCNLRCFYCYEPLETREGKSVMTSEQIEAAFAAIHQIRAERPDLAEARVGLFGGEPLLPITREPVREILQRAMAEGFRVNVTSNGTHISDFYDILLPYAGRVSFQITVDGPAEIHDTRRINAAGRGTFGTICKNVTWLLEHRFATMVRVNLDRHNVEELPALFRTIEEHGWHNHEYFACQIAPVTDRSGLKFDTHMQPPIQLVARLAELVPDLAALMRRLKVVFAPDMFRTILPLANMVYPDLVGRDWMPYTHYCEAAHLRFYVFGTDGQIYPCPEAIGSEVRLGRFWPHLEMDRDAMALWKDRSVLTVPKCKSCEYAFLCGGGCPLAAVRHSGSPRSAFCEAKPRLRDSLNVLTPGLLAVARGGEEAGEG